ncbi:MAG: AAA family ATPase [Anaerolineae bacterium]|nr:AAA family ATPase [Anaerolineae bacterium]
MDNLKNMLQYWRNSLVDSDRMGVKPEKLEAAFTVQSSDIALGCATPTDPNVAQWLTKAFEDSHDNVKGPIGKLLLPVLIAPLVLRPTTVHGKARFTAKPFRWMICPLWIPAIVSEDLTITPQEDGVAWVARDLLEPSTTRYTSTIIGTVEDLDRFLSYNPPPQAPDWPTHLSYACEMFKAVTEMDIDQFHLKDFVRDQYAYVLPASKIDSSSRNIKNLYEYLHDSPSHPALLKRYVAASQRAPLRSLLAPREQWNTSRYHLGQMTDSFPLSRSQREALHHFMTIQDGDILAINGPPGTGKTTLLQSIIATLWVQAAIEETEPPVIVAASANNQAVTNVIDSFGEIGANRPEQGGRWLPEVKSYGLYCVSSMRARDQSEEIAKREWQFATPRQNEFFSQIENSEYLKKAKRHFLNCFEQRFGQRIPMISAAKGILHQKLRELQGDLILGLDLAARREEVQEHYKQDIDDISRTLDSLIEYHQQRVTDLGNTLNNWRRSITQRPFWLALLKFIPPAQEQIIVRNQVHFSTGNFTLPVAKLDDKSICDYLERTIRVEQEALHSSQTELSQLTYLQTQWEQWCVKHSDGYSANLDLAELLDRQLRFEMFILATHYWEARYLLELEEQLSQNFTGQISAFTSKAWLRYAKITPCFVSTFHMMPAFFSVDDEYLLDFIDLLIVDEAGQVAPEVGGASFALAKKALVVGDVLQIEPVVTVPRVVDYGNLKECNVVLPEDRSSEAESVRTYLSATQGSVMKIAQQASYYQATEDERGMFLSEHRRCVPEIISYCNDLAYDGLLEPRRPSISDPVLPFMGYAHIPGKAQKVGGSRRNDLEATVIVEWLKTHREMLIEKFYDDEDPNIKDNEKLGRIVGILTPFVPQANLIRAKLDENMKGMTVGTVHALQGAERRIVIFSPVYDSPGNFFFDQGKNMLNVAVSRAKDSFLVFGNMEIFEPRPRQASLAQRPSSLLASYLFSDESNEIDAFRFIDDNQLYTGKPRQCPDVSHLTSLGQHRKVLQRAFEVAERQVHIVSPYLTQDAVETDSISKLATQACRRGVQVIVYADDQLNRDKRGNEKASTQRAKEILCASGIQVKVVNRVHNKTLCVDDRIFIVGSFNWLSASRDPGNKYQRYETSICYQGAGAGEMIEQTISAMENRLLVES